LTLLFTVAAPPVSYIRSLHDALPISARDRAREPHRDLLTNDVEHDPTADRVAVANLADRLGRLGGPLDDRRARLRWRGRGRGRLGAPRGARGARGARGLPTAARAALLFELGQHR